MVFSNFSHFPTQTSDSFLSIYFLSSQALIPPFQTLMEGTFATMWKASHRQGKGHQEGSDARVLSSGPTQAQPIGVFYNL